MTLDAGRGPRGPVLVIDRDRELREHLSRRLEERGYEVEAVHNTRRALDKLRAGLEPCLIVFDLRLLYEGLHLRRRAELGNRSFASFPVVAYTADDESSWIAETAGAALQLAASDPGAGAGELARIDQVTQIRF